jgi:hypothetical protein
MRARPRKRSAISVDVIVERSKRYHNNNTNVRGSCLAVPRDIAPLDMQQQERKKYTNL